MPFTILFYAKLHGSLFHVTFFEVRNLKLISFLLSLISASATASTLVVPEMSYSSSEGEDDFYDANDSPFTPGSQTTTPT